jgi:hypothetical protein
MPRNRFIDLLGAALIAAAFPALSQSLEKLEDRYAAFAGSESNAKSLVSGLRNGTDITLTSSGSGGATATIDPPTKKMGNGNVNIALALAEASLKQQGITNPTPEQIKAALNGGTIKTAAGDVQLAGVLQMRADGKGWGQIAQSLGFKLGEVMRSEKANGAIAAHRQEGGKDNGERVARTERGPRIERAERVERVERPERPERPEKPERVGPGR